MARARQPAALGHVTELTPLIGVPWINGSGSDAQTFPPSVVAQMRLGESKVPVPFAGRVVAANQQSEAVAHEIAPAVRPTVPFGSWDGVGDHDMPPSSVASTVLVTADVPAALS